MKRLILVRHAKTEPLTDADSDFTRQLKKRGHKDARMIADHLIGKTMVPEMIISSPAHRTLQTARIMAGSFSIPESEIKEVPFIYDGFSLEELVSEIASIAGDKDSVMVVGHNPDIALMAIQFSGEKFFHFPTSATSVIGFSVSEWSQIKAGTGRADMFIYPKELKGKKD
jgi:phosphohistidine phosphatase